MILKTTPQNIYKDIGINLPKYPKLLESEKLKVEIKTYKPKRSLNQNALMWAIMEDMAKYYKTTAEEIYKLMLQRYGVHDYLGIPKNTKNLDKILETFSHYEIQESTLENVTRIKVYLGSSTYDTKEMKRLIDGIISECEGKIDIEYYSKELKSLLEE